MNIDDNKYFLLWPSLKMYGLEKDEICKKIFGNNDFTLYIECSVSKKDGYNNEPIDIFWKVPDVYTIGFHPHSYTNSEGRQINSHLYFSNFTTNTEEGYKVNREGKYFDFEFEKNYTIKVTYQREKNELSYYLDNKLMYQTKIEYGFYDKDQNPQILLGRNDFGTKFLYKVNFNFLIISKVVLDDSKIKNIKNGYLSELDEYNQYTNSKKYQIIGMYDFKEMTNFKVYDYTGNNNHIYIQTLV